MGSPRLPTEAEAHRPSWAEKSKPGSDNSLLCRFQGPQCPVRYHSLRPTGSPEVGQAPAVVRTLPAGPGCCGISSKELPFFHLPRSGCPWPKGQGTLTAPQDGITSRKTGLGGQNAKCHVVLGSRRIYSSTEMPELPGKGGGGWRLGVVSRWPLPSLTALWPSVLGSCFCFCFSYRARIRHQTRRAVSSRLEPLQARSFP